MNSIPDTTTNLVQGHTDKTDGTIDKTKIPLRRVLGLTSAIALVAGNIIGSGIFKKIVPMAATGMSKNEILLAWLVPGIIVLLGAFTMAGLAKSTTATGGLYEYARLSFGKFAGFLVGWAMFILGFSAGSASIAFVFAQSVNALVALPNPLHQFDQVSIGHFIFPFESSGIKILAIAAIALLTWYNCRGVRKSSVLNNLVTGLKILGILVLIVCGLFFAGGAGKGGSPLVATSVNLHHGGFLSIFFAAALAAFFGYEGFTDVTAVSGEIKNPKRNLPIALITGVGIVIVLYVLINDAFMKAVPLQQLGNLGENNIAAVFVAGKILGNGGKIFVSLLIMVSTFGALHSNIVLGSRIYYRMAQKNIFFRQAAKVHPVFRTPNVAMIFLMAWSIVLVISGTFDLITDMSVFIDFILYALMAVALIKLKTKKVITGKIPLYPWAPLIFILFVIGLSVNTLITMPKLSFLGLALTAPGIPFYFYFKKKYKNLPEGGDEEEME